LILQLDPVKQEYYKIQNMRLNEYLL
jgi:hypothetical protein